MASIQWRERQRKWYAYFWVPGEKPGAKRRRVGRPIPGSPREEDLNFRQKRALRVQADRMEEEERGRLIREARGEVDPGDLRFAGLALQYLQDKAVSCSPATVRRYKTVLVLFANRTRNRDIRLITEADVRRFRDARLGAGRSARTVAADVKDLRAFFNWASRPGRGWIEQNPAALVGLPRWEATEKALPSRQEVQRMVDLLFGEGDREMLALGVLGACCGMRAGDILQLKKENVDLHRREIHVYRGKSKRPRTIPMPDVAARVFEGWNLEGDGWLFPSMYKTSAGMRSDALRKDFTDWLRRNGFRFTHKLLRDYVNDSVRRSGVEESARLLVLGHSDSEVNRIYSHPKAEEVREALNSLVDPPEDRRKDCPAEE